MSTELLGIDVSEANGKLDWSRLKAAGVRFAIIRSGYGVSHRDNQFVANVQGAIANGIPFGIYHFSYALSTEGAKKEAAYCLSLIAPYRSHLQLPVYFDLEYDSVRYAKEHGVTIDKAACTAHTAAFIGAVAAAGYTPGVYFNRDYRDRMLDFTVLKSAADCSLWYANWNTGAEHAGCDLWQYTDCLKLAGHSCRFDGNRCSEATLTRLAAGATPQAAAAVIDPVPETNTNTTNTKEEYDPVKTWVNGTTKEYVYADTAKRTRIGYLNPHVSCDCLGRAGSMYVVRYTANGGTQKVGLVSYHGGVR